MILNDVYRNEEENESFKKSVKIIPKQEKTLDKLELFN